MVFHLKRKVTKVMKDQCRHSYGDSSKYSVKEF
jgi:hypothetical protein